jgi:predicted  nucleic acid-binding Zn-ribbon protein
MVEAGRMKQVPDASPRAEVEHPAGIQFTRPLAPEPKPEKRTTRKKARKADKVVKAEAMIGEGKPAEAAPKVKAKRPKARKAKEGRPHDELGVITIVESGVYEIDVLKLLDDSPIIIEKDGTYLIHLPSLLETKEKGKK